MDREVPYDKNLICDCCGKKGAFDFMGDYFCSDCAKGCSQCHTVFISKDPKRHLCPDCLPSKQDSP